MGQEKMSPTLAETQQQVTIGIDISKHQLDAHLHPAGLTRLFTNDRKGHAQLIAWAKPHCPSRIVFEATGAYHRALEMALGQAGLPAVKVNPLQARLFAEATGKRVKTDPVDAAMLARFGAVLQPEEPPAKDATIDQLAELLTARRALVKDQTAAHNRGKTLTLDLLKRQNQHHLRQIDAQILAIDQAQAAILARHAALKARFDILVSVPGLGAVTALALLIDMPELGSLDARQAASLAGVVPITRQSGRWQGKSRIQGGRAILRQAIYMPALVAIRFNPPLKEKYLALRQAGKPAKVAIVAIMRKLIITANALLRDNRRWTQQARPTAAFSCVGLGEAGWLD
jgi:transposase